jgi:branched-chain amino acid aminotransferase
LSNNSYVYLKDKFVKSNKAMISIAERGFRYGDGVFETVRVNNKQLFQWDLHKKRLIDGLNFLNISASSGIKNICLELIKKNNLENGFVRISISRGIGSDGYLPSNKIASTLIIETIVAKNNDFSPIDLWLSDYKKTPDECIPSGAKTMQGLNSTLSRMQARDNGCFEALLMDIKENIAEGSSSNIFWFKDKKLYTPKNNILLGTMRHAVIKLSPYEVIQGDYKIDNLITAEEIFLTNVSWLIKPVKSIKPLGYNYNRFEISKKILDLITKDSF